MIEPRVTWTPITDPASGIYHPEAYGATTAVLADDTEAIQRRLFSNRGGGRRYAEVRPNLWLRLHRRTGYRRRTWPVLMQLRTMAQLL